MPRVQSSLRQFYLVAPADEPGPAVACRSIHLDDCQGCGSFTIFRGPSCLDVSPPLEEFTPQLQVYRFKHFKVLWQSDDLLYCTALA